MSVLSSLCHLSFSFASHLPLAGGSGSVGSGAVSPFSYCPLPFFQQHSRADDAKPSASLQSQRHCTSAAKTFRSSYSFFCFAVVCGGGGFLACRSQASFVSGTIIKPLLSKGSVPYLVTDWCLGGDS